MNGNLDLSSGILLLALLGFVFQKALSLVAKDLRKNVATLKKREIFTAKGSVTINELEEHDELQSLPLFYRDLSVARFLRMPVLLACVVAFAVVIWILMSGANESFVTKKAFAMGLIVTLSSAALNMAVVTFIERTNTRLEDLCRD